MSLFTAPPSVSGKLSGSRCGGFVSPVTLVQEANPLGSPCPVRHGTRRHARALRLAKSCCTRTCVVHRIPTGSHGRPAGCLTVTDALSHSCAVSRLSTFGRKCSYLLPLSSPTCKAGWVQPCWCVETPCLSSLSGQVPGCAELHGYQPAWTAFAKDMSVEVTLVDW